MRGVGEVLNETVCVLDKCEGLTVSILMSAQTMFRRMHYLNIIIGHSDLTEYALAGLHK